jgi:hypothetical protein
VVLCVRESLLAATVMLKVPVGVPLQHAHQPLERVHIKVALHFDSASAQ